MYLSNPLLALPLLLLARPCLSGAIPAQDTIIRTQQMSHVLNFLSQIKLYLSRQERTLSRSLLDPPCANSLVKGLLGKCRYGTLLKF